MEKPLSFIDVTDINTERKSSIMTGGKRDKGALCIIGNLEHAAEIVPASRDDADKLIAWLQEWKKNN